MGQKENEFDTFGNIVEYSEIVPAVLSQEIGQGSNFCAKGKISPHESKFTECYLVIDNEFIFPFFFSFNKNKLQGSMSGSRNSHNMVKTSQGSISGL